MNARSAWLSADGQTLEDTRVAPLGALTPTSPVATRSGILPGSYDGRHRVSGFWLAGVDGTMTATVSSGRAVVQAGESRGAYPVALTEGVPLTFADGDPQYGRIDLVVLRVYDHAYDGSGRTEAVVEIIQGTPAASPAAPAVPEVSLPLFRVAVAATTSAGTGGVPWGSARTDLRPTTVAVGGILPALAGDTTAGAYPGQYRDLNGILQRWNGAAWLTAMTPPAFTGSVDSGKTTSTTYTATLSDTAVTALALTFTAPPTGAVLLSMGARMQTENSSTATAFMSPQITQGSTVILPASDDTAVVYGGAVPGSVSTQLRLYGLTAGASYTLTALHRSSDAAVTCWFDNLFLRVEASA
ncbi:hypothetical protein I2W78_15520 [Streptomyces spinoverrucosus]|uniref:hypothetical protein n=1 Tax=Streptomyces spinoverrucosus TaxID=284043 RepID=UPI0018C377CD|nr:hypothetical protein [Streptomyces spinoverrucosus]MBG0853219.1 hypothetical protein [Streptomyces spinoverrucosus]